MNIFVFCASNSSKSINKELLKECVKHLDGNDFTFKTMADFELPVFGQDLEGNGQPYPTAALDFIHLVQESDAIILATPEHNSSMPAAFKNLVDWCSRYPDLGKNKVFHNKPVFLLSTTPGGRGGKSNLEHLSSVMPWWGADIQKTLSVPSFYTHYDKDADTLDSETMTKVQTSVNEFMQTITSQPEVLA